VFSYLSLATLVLIFSVRTLLMPLWHVGLLSNPPLLLAVGLGILLQLFVIQISSFQYIVGAAPLVLAEWNYIFIAILVVVVSVEFLKSIFRHFKLDVR
jgi:Ca2+-transporting ATPase